MHVVAILVAFDALRDPRKLAVNAATAVDHVIVVDNAVGGHPRLDRFEGTDDISLLRNNNVGGLAGAYNAALAAISERTPAATHVLFLDDDTDVTTIGVFLTSAATLEAASRTDVAAVAPMYEDRQTGLRGKHIALSRFFYRMLPRDLHKPTEVTFLINSMSLWRCDALREVGDYSQRLAIDHIDTDYCMRAKRLGYRTILNPHITFKHSIGDRRSYRLCGITLQSGGHGVDRRRLIGRNTAIIARNHGFAYPAFAVLCVQRILYESMGVILAERNRWQKLQAIWGGFFSGLRSRGT